MKLNVKIKLFLTSDQVEFMENGDRCRSVRIHMKGRLLTNPSFCLHEYQLYIMLHDVLNAVQVDWIFLSFTTLVPVFLSREYWLLISSGSIVDWAFLLIRLTRKERKSKVMFRLQSDSSCCQLVTCRWVADSFLLCLSLPRDKGRLQVSGTM